MWSAAALEDDITVMSAGSSLVELGDREVLNGKPALETAEGVEF